MANTDWLDALNDCIDRMNAGESIDECLHDYPQHAARLRQLLEAGELVYRAQQFDSETAADREQVRRRILDRSDRQRISRRKWLRYFAAAAALINVLIFAAAVLLSSMEFSEHPELHLTITARIGFKPTLPAFATQTQAPNLIVGATAMPTLLPETSTPLGLPANPSIVPTSVALMSPVPGTATMTATGTPTPLPTRIPAGTATPGSIGTPTPPGTSDQQPFTSTPTPYTEVFPLQAGEIDDNARWDQYLLYRSSFLSQFAYAVHDVRVNGRQIILVADAQGLPVLGARVQIYDGQTLISETRTYATGRTLFFPQANPLAGNPQSFRVVISKGNSMTEFALDPQRGPEWHVTLDAAQQNTSAIQLDVLFLLDATGSMADEIAQLQSNIMAISAQIDALPGSIDTRYALVAYRDRGDAYVTRIDDFTPDLGSFQTSLNNISASGGGDTPEALNEALHNAIQNVGWRGEDTVKLVFLVADAPPHLDYANDYDYAQEMVTAAQRGIKIHPIASSGLSPDGEFIFRQIAQYTMGRFIFLTYDQGTSGAPGESRSDLNVGTPGSPDLQQPGDYTVEQLDKLVLRLIQDELNALRSPVNIGQAITVQTPRPLPSPTVNQREGTPPPAPT